MKQTGKRLIAVFAALALTFSVFTVGSDTTEVKAEQAPAASTYYDELTVNDTQKNVEYTVNNLTVASSGSITLGSHSGEVGAKAATVKVTGSAVVNGLIRLQGHNGLEGVLEVGKSAVLNILREGLIETPEEEFGYIFVEEGASVIYCNQNVEISVDEKKVVIDGSQRFSCRLFCKNGSWSGKAVDITLPGQRKDLNDWLEKFPDIKFNTVTIKDYSNSEINYELDRSIRAAKLVVNTQKKLTIKAGSENVRTIPTIVDVDEAELNDTVTITDFTGSSEGVANVFLVRNKLMIDGSSGGIKAVGNGCLKLDSDGLPREIYTPALSCIESEREVRIPKGSKIITTTVENVPYEGRVDMGPFSQNEVKFDGVDNKNDDYIFIFDGRGGIIKDGGPGLSLSVILPEQEKIFGHTRYRYDWINRDKTDYPPIVFDSITVNRTSKEAFDFNIGIKELSVASGSALLIRGREDFKNPDDHADSVVSIKNKATIEGTLLLQGAEGKAGYLEIVNGATLSIAQGGEVITSENGTIRPKVGAIIKVGSDYLKVNFDGKEAVFDGSQKIGADLWFNGTSWTGKITSGSLETTTTPTDNTQGSGSGTTTNPTQQTPSESTTETEPEPKTEPATEPATATDDEPEIKKQTTTTDKAEDGTQTTTTSTTYTDGSKVTEKVVEKPDGTITTTSTAKDAEGNVLSSSKVVEKTKEDGTKTITATEKNADGSSSTSKTTVNTDGSSKTNTTTKNVDGSTTKEKITEKADGSLTRTATTTDEDGNVLATEKEKVSVSKSGTETRTTTVEKANGSSSKSVVKTKADGSATSTLTETDPKGNVSVTVGSKKIDGSEISKSYAVEDDGVVLTAVEATTTSASIPASVKVNGKSVPVTSVGEGAMKDNKTVKTVKLAETITSIGEGAFSGAKNLKTIKLSANVTEIAPGAFDGIKSNATFYISAATDEEFDALVELLKKSGVGSKVKFKRAKK